MVGRVFRAYKEISNDVGKHVKGNKRGPVFYKKFPWWFFDGACKEGICGCGIILNISNNHAFHMQLGAWTGTNTRAEMLAMWGLFDFAKKNDFQRIQIAGDSMVIVKWFQGS